MPDLVAVAEEAINCDRTEALNGGAD